MLARRRLLQSLVAVPLTGLAGLSPALASATSPQLLRWQAATADFGDWATEGTSRDPEDRLVLDAVTAGHERDPYPAGGYYGRNFYTGGDYLVGTATSPMVSLLAFREAIVSWEAETPTGSWLETRLRVQLGDRWSTWYHLGVWAADDSTVARHSVTSPDDGDARVAVDTLMLRSGAPSAEALQLQVRLFANNGEITPRVRGLTVTTSLPARRPGQTSPGEPRYWDRWLTLPAYSQMVYPDGGRAWCSPTSLAMVLGYWSGGEASAAERVRAAVAGVYDWRYRGHGNWPFNTAHAASHGLSAYVARLPDLAAAEPWTAAGVPLILSLAWGAGELAGAPLASVNGHLLVLAGFDASGNAVVHDPAAPNDSGVRRLYRRDQLEALWLEHSAGTVYITHPGSWPSPDKAPASTEETEPRPE